jgi:hypothetical protein
VRIVVMKKSKSLLMRRHEKIYRREGRVIKAINSYKHVFAMCQNEVRISRRRMITTSISIH